MTVFTTSSNIEHMHQASTEKPQLLQNSGLRAPWNDWVPIWESDFEHVPSSRGKGSIRDFRERSQAKTSAMNHKANANTQVTHPQMLPCFGVHREEHSLNMHMPLHSLNVLGWQPNLSYHTYQACAYRSARYRPALTGASEPLP